MSDKIVVLKDGELVTPNDQEEGLVEDSMTEETAEISGNASQEPEIEDRSREVDGTKQRTVVVPAQGDRPSFDIKIVNPVVSLIALEFQKTRLSF